MILTMWSSCGKGAGPGPGLEWEFRSMKGAWSIGFWSKLVPLRWLLCRWMVAGSGRTFGASNITGVEFCRRWFCRRCCILEVALDSIMYASRVRMGWFSKIYGMVSCWSETAQSQLPFSRGSIQQKTDFSNLTQRKLHPPGGEKLNSSSEEWW